MDSSSVGYAFVSYSRNDLAIQQRILAALRERGISVWVDTENLVPGTPNWERTIENGIKGCGAIIVLLSPTASKSEWVLREVIYADVHQKHIIPVLIDGNDRSSIPFHLISYQRVDLTKGQNWNFGLQQLSDTFTRYSRIEVEKMRLESEMVVQEDAARQATIKAAQEKIMRESAEKSARDEAKRLEAERIVREEAKRKTAEATKRKVVEESARKDWITSDDKLWALLTYIFTPLVPTIILLMDDKKNRPFIRLHNAQSLVWGISSFILNTLLSMIFIGIFTSLISFFISIYWGIQAYNGQTIDIPLITNFVKNQGWA